jgi:hypothetical protein
MPIAVGMYLPFGLAMPILIGGLIAYFHTRKTPPPQHDRVLHRGILFSSGVIAGEALTAVALACLAALGITALDPTALGVGISTDALTVISLLAAAAAVVAFIRMTRPQI